MRDLTLAFVASSNSAFRIVENKQFLDLVAYVSNQQAKIPVAKTLMSDLDNKFQKIKEKLKKTIAVTNHVCTTADIWTNKSSSFMGVTIHFFDENLERKSNLLAFRRFFGRHTHQAVAEIIMNIHREFNIKRTKVTHIVTDGASNFRKAFKVFGSSEKESVSTPTADLENETVTQDDENELDIEQILGPDANVMFYPDDVDAVNMEWHSYVDDEEDELDDYASLPAQLRCVSHMLNLLGKDFEKKMSSRCSDAYKNAYRKLKRFWEVNSRSTVAHEIILEICKRSFPYPNSTRWNADFDAVEVAEKHKQLIKLAIENINRETQLHLPRSKKSKPLEVLTATEWKILKDYVVCMRPIAEALDIIQGEERACAGYILPTLYGIKACLNENIENNVYVSDFGKSMNETMLQCLSNRFDDMMKICDENKSLILAAAIHPCFKLTWLENEMDREYVQTLLINTYVEMANSLKKSTTDETTKEIYDPTSEKKSKESLFFKRLRAGERRTSTDDNLTFDVWKYMLQTIDDPNLNQIRGVPILDHMFRCFNTTLASSAAVERIFSQALIVFSNRRNRISNENFEKILFVNRNRDLH